MSLKYPNKIQFKELESCSDSYQSKKDFFYKIDCLYRGGKLIEENKHLFLHKRLDEDKELYKLRLERFTYTNILASILSRITGRFSTGDLIVNGLGPQFTEVWNEFRERVDKRTDEKTFLSELLKHLMLYQDCVIQVDKPQSNIEVTNRAQEKELELDLVPYLVVYKPSELLNCGDAGNKRSWYKFRILEEQANPFGDSIYRCTWRFIDDRFITEYTALVELDENSGDIKYFLIDGEKIAAQDDTTISLSGQIEHNFNDCPVIKLSIPDEKYAAGQAYLKLKQYLQVENGITDTSLSSGYVQRVITPYTEKEDDINVITESDIKSDNAHIIKAQSFRFEEIQGSSIQTNLKLLEKIEGQILDLVCISGSSVYKEALTRAAASKKIDESSLEYFLRSYGSLITTFYRDILSVVAEAIGDSTAIKDISVSGYDAYDIDDLSDSIELARKIEDIKDNLSPEAIKQFYSRISLALNKNANAREKTEVQQQIA